MAQDTRRKKKEKLRTAKKRKELKNTMVKVKINIKWTTQKKQIIILVKK